MLNKLYVHISIYCTCTPSSVFLCLSVQWLYVGRKVDLPVASLGYYTLWGVLISVRTYTHAHTRRVAHTYDKSHTR